MNNFALNLFKISNFHNRKTVYIFCIDVLSLNTFLFLKKSIFSIQNFVLHKQTEVSTKLKFRFVCLSVRLCYNSDKYSLMS